MSNTQFTAEKAENLQEIEKQFAVKAVEHAQVYWNILGALPPSSIKLTKLDDEIFADLSESFPDYITNTTLLSNLNEDSMKDKGGKDLWRPFMMRYEKRVKDYNFGSLVRTNSEEEYSQSNTMFVPRIQFYAIEIARNRLGLNDKAHEIAKADAEELKKSRAQ